MATAIFLSFGFAVIDSASAFALDGPSRTRHAIHLHLAGKRVGDRLAPGYAGPVPSAASGAAWQFTPGRGIIDEPCDLPTSGCSNDERISN